MLSSETKRRIDAARDILVGKLPLPTDQVELITLALIYKFMDDLDEQSVQLGGKRSYFIKDLEPYRWRTLLSQKISGTDRVKLFADGLEALGDAKTAKHLPEMFRDIFRNAMLKFRDGQTLTLFLAQIDGFTYSHSEELGNAFEYLLQTMQVQGDNGQFRTPRHIIDFIVDILEPTPEDKILDPACGTGGFLVSAYKHILAKHTSKDSAVPGDQLTPAKREKISKNIVGYDITPLMVKLSEVNLFLHGFSAPDIHEYDTLSNDARWNDKFDLILANPPFMTPKGGVTPHNKFRVTAKKAEVLFTDYIAEHLTTNGRAGIIVPEGIIFQSATAYKALRKFLVEDCLVAVISLPAGVFNPYSGVKTSILILDKELARKTDSIAFFKVENDGFDLGAQRRPVEQNDLPKLTKEIQEHMEGLRSGKNSAKHDKLHIVTKAKIAANGEFNLSGEKYREGTAITGSYPWHKIESITQTITPPSKIPKTAIGSSGRFPVIDQSQEDIAGWTEDESALIRPRKPLVIFGDHTCAVKFTETPFAQGADGIKILETADSLEPKFLFQVLRAKPLKSVGYQRHYSLLKEMQIPLPPLEIQKEIVAEIEGYQKVIDGARSVIENYKPHIPIDPKWPVVELGDLCELYQPKTITQDDLVQNGEYPVFGANGIIGRYNQYNHEDPEVLITCRGATCGTINKSLPKSWVTGNAMVAKPKDKRLSKEFLFYALQSMRLDSTISGSAQPQITRQSLAPFKLFLPSLEDQQGIVVELQKEQAMVDTNKELIARFEKKIQAVMDRVWGNGTGE